MSSTTHAPPQPPTNPQVVIVGAGPVGLWLAHEIALAGVRTLVLERDEKRSPHSKALGIQPRTVEVLAMRGRHKDILAAGRPVPNWHFGMLESRIDFSSLPTPFPFLLAQPQSVTENLLERYATGQGAVVWRGHEVTSLTQDPASVTVGGNGPDGAYEVSAPYVVGTDGARSTVRRAAGIDFPRTDTSAYGFLGEVILDEPPQTPGFAALTDAGRLIVVPLPDRRYRVTGYDPANQRRDVPLTLEELRRASLRIAGTDFGMREPSWLTRFGNATKLAATYRDRRVLLAGDAAHIHFPAGGVGLNVGLQDAMNLGWKLAAVIQGRAHPHLLDTYHAERHPVGAELAEHTMAQTALITGLTPEVSALRSLLNQAVAGEPAFARMLAGKLSGLDTVYRPADPGAHPLTGSRAHDPEGEGILALLHDGRAVLLTMGEPAHAEVGERAAAAGISVHHSRLAHTGGPAWSGVSAALIRPDGRVWWATEEPASGAEFVAEVVNALDRLPATF
ncbi:FAD-dependent monooxygenase [Streptomyces sp. NPDC005708]|uniref:FAD-dependent monooxygenase n=1 Tax=Streptomyces sp. NPDC005708 TaxID=3154564 RepID=UPI0033F752AD